MTDYEYFHGKEIGTGTGEYRVYWPLGTTADMSTPLFDGQTFTDLTPILDPGGEQITEYGLTKLKVDITGGWPAGLMPLPWDPKWPKGDPTNYPYLNATNYKNAIDSLASTHVLKLAYDAAEAETLSGKPLDGIVTLLKSNKTDREQAANDIIDFVNSNAASLSTYEDALPQGLPRKANTLDEDWYQSTSTGWVAKLIFGLLDALANG